MRIADTTNMGRRRTGVATAFGVSAALLAFAIALAGVSSAGNFSPSGRPLSPPLRISVPRLDPAALEHARGSVRVVITLRAQPVLAAAQRGPGRAAITGRLNHADHR